VQLCPGAQFEPCQARRSFGVDIAKIKRRHPLGPQGQGRLPKHKPVGPSRTGMRIGPPEVICGPSAMPHETHCGANLPTMMPMPHTKGRFGQSHRKRGRKRAVASVLALASLGINQKSHRGGISGPDVDTPARGADHPVTPFALRRRLQNLGVRPQRPKGAKTWADQRHKTKTVQRRLGGGQNSRPLSRKPAQDVAAVSVWKIVGPDRAAQHKPHPASLQHLCRGKHRPRPVHNRPHHPCAADPCRSRIGRGLLKGAVCTPPHIAIGVRPVNLHGAVNAYETEQALNGSMNYKITPDLAPAPRITLWVPLIVAVLLSAVFLLGLMLLG
jgi:hypothetical protein